MVFSVVIKNRSAVNGAKLTLSTAGNPNNHHFKKEIPLCFSSLMQRIVKLTENVTNSSKSFQGPKRKNISKYKLSEVFEWLLNIINNFLFCSWLPISYALSTVKGIVRNWIAHPLIFQQSFYCRYRFLCLPIFLERIRIH